VIVSVYYRLSSFGFLSHPDFLSNPTLADLNAGLRDQIEALRWVNKYIWAFGGDSNKVTINGQSAGGASVMLHMVMNRDEPAGGLFKAAIAQSVYRTPMPTPQQQVPLFEEYSRIAGCGNGTLGEKLSCLRSASVSSLAKAQDANK
jgi:carboxylesterase type B